MHISSDLLQSSNLTAKAADGIAFLLHVPLLHKYLIKKHEVKIAEIKLQSIFLNLHGFGQGFIIVLLFREYPTIL